jgi:hypothetical protein
MAAASMVERTRFASFYDPGTATTGWPGRRGKAAELFSTLVPLIALLISQNSTTFVLVYAPGVTMTQETYRFAFEEATSELREIAGQFEVLRVRKEQVEQVIDALRPLLSDGQVADSIVDKQVAIEAAPFLVQSAPEMISTPAPEAIAEPEPEPAYVEQSSDPFQRRIDNALRHGFGGRESRVMPRALSGLLSRA